MKGYIYLVRGGSVFSREDIIAHVMNDLVPRLRALRPEYLQVDLPEWERPKFTVLPLGSEPLAMILLRGDFGEAGEKISRALSISPAIIQSYKVDSSFPWNTGRDWPLGEPTPGVVLLTLFRRKPGLTDDLFLERWFGEHTPLSFRVHPFLEYTRNRVTACLSDFSQPFEGIVEERFPDMDHLLNPVKMFGGFPVFIINMVRVLRHVNTFIDMETIENYLLREHILIGEPAGSLEGVLDVSRKMAKV